MRLAWAFAWLLVIAGCASASTYLPETEPAVPGLAPRHDDPKSCIQGPEDELPPAPNEAWLKREVNPRIATARACGPGLANRGSVAISVHASPGEKPDVRIIASSERDCAVIACIKRSFADLPPAPSAASFTHQLTLPPDAAPTRAADASHPPSQPSCLDAPRPEDSKPHAPDDAGGGGRLPPETIQAVVRASYGEIRRCYEDGLGRDPNLAGRLTTRFVIGVTGHVSAVRTSGNAIADCGVASCVRAHFARLVFPKPSGGVVTVVYPLVLEP